jgi:hypothetical protein
MLILFSQIIQIFNQDISTKLFKPKHQPYINDLQVCIVYTTFIHIHLLWKPIGVDGIFEKGDIRRFISTFRMMCHRGVESNNRIRDAALKKITSKLKSVINRKSWFCCEALLLN